MAKIENSYPELTAEAFQNYSFILNIEKNFDHISNKAWLEEVWFTHSVSYILIYLVTIFSIQHLMKDRKKFELRTPLLIWNVALAIFSIIASIRLIPQFFNIIINYGYFQSLCAPVDIMNDPVAIYWSYLFALSKVYELGDTLFVVLRKQKLIFLHWYHHITVLSLVWFTSGERFLGGNARYYMTMNYFVHSIMYSYYAAKAAKLSPPKFISMIITALQLIQMIIGVTITVTAMYYQNECAISKENSRFAVVIYTSYFMLFAKFFYDAYIAPPSSTSKINKNLKSS